MAHLPAVLAKNFGIAEDGLEESPKAGAVHFPGEVPCHWTPDKKAAAGTGRITPGFRLSHPWISP